MAWPLALLGATVLMSATSTPVQAHQLANAQGHLVPHNHVYKRAGYGQGLVVGHVAPTRHGNNMIIWSPAPSAAYGTPRPQMHITQPSRQVQGNRLQAPQGNQQLQNLRDLDPRKNRR